MPTRSDRPRRHDLDWLRVLAILLLVVFHTGMLFTAEWGWHIKNGETSSLVLELNYFMSRWRMALLFVISGVGTGYALGFRSGGGYLKERAWRLLLPLTFGILAVVPPQIYFERLAQGQAYASYLEFWPSVLELVPYPAGSTSWHHLWFVGYLFLYSVVLLPVFLFLRSARGRALRERVDGWLAGPGLYLAALPLGAILAALLPVFQGPQNVVDDWAYLLYYMVLFLFGYLLGDAGRAWDAILLRRRTSLTVAVSTMLLINALRWNDADPYRSYEAASVAWELLQALNAWAWVLAILGYGRRHLTRSTPFLRYANEGIYPFYILHQTVIVVIGYYVVQVNEGLAGKYLFTILASYLVTAALYECFVRPFRIPRLLFGMKPAAGRAWRGSADPARLPETTTASAA